MEINLSRKSIHNLIGIILLAAALGGGYYAWTQGLMSRWLDEEPPQTQPVTDPALQSLASLYTPTGERAAWEAQVCAGMTEQGCQLFRALYAGPLWESAQGQTAAVAFVEVADRLEDESQVWEMNLTLAETSLPVYIHVAQNDAGQWLIHRVLFEQEAARYENQ